MRQTIYAKENKDKIIERYLKNLDMAKNLIDTIIPVVWKYDCKVYNKRFDNAIKDIIEDRKLHTEGKTIYPYVELNYRHLSIKLAFYNHRVTENNLYLPQGYEEVYICYHYSNWSDWDNDRIKEYHRKDNGEFFYIDENGNTRIQAKKIVDELLEKQKEIEEKIEEIEKAVKNVEETYRKVYELKEELSSIHDSIPHIVDKVYEIDSYGSYTS